MAVLKRRLMYWVFFSADATAQEMLSERNIARNRLIAAGFTAEQVTLHGPFDHVIERNGNTIEVKVAIAEVTPT